MKKNVELLGYCRLRKVYRAESAGEGTGEVEFLADVQSVEPIHKREGHVWRSESRDDMQSGRKR